MTRTVLISANTGWNLLNFRIGLIRALRVQGWRVVAVAPSDPAATGKLEALGCIVEPVSLDSVGLNPTRDLRTLAQYVRLMRRYRPSHYLSWTPKPNVYGAMAARMCGVTAIINISGIGSVFIADSMLTRFVQHVYRFAFAGARTAFFQNQTDRDLFLARKLVRPSQAVVLPGSGVDLTHFRPSSASVMSSAPVFVLIARLLRDKGVEEFVGAAEALRARGVRARFQLLGPVGVINPTAIGRDRLRQWVEAGAVEYLGEAEDVRPFIAAADCVVLPSYREGTARVLLEAGAMGKPVVATDVPGCRDPIEHGRTGLLCEVRSVESLASALAAMAALTPDERAAMGAAGRAKMEAEYDQRIVIDRYLLELAR
ncbi:MAG: glycosyltransferase family 4 protein [Janthinobacterium lividum]